MIPTAKDFFESKMWVNHKHPNYEDMVEFAKLHVTEALKRAHSNFQLPEEDLEFTLNVYPLEGIK